MSDRQEITATVTAFDRIDQTLDTIRRLRMCRPPPNEILVHVDAGRIDCAQAICAAFPDITVLLSEMPVGPGGGRNNLMNLARAELVANFDDDSYPIDLDFFARAAEVFDLFPEVSLVAASIYLPGERVGEDYREIWPTTSFVGCGVVFRRKHVIETGGYLPLAIAYGAEEEDMALRMIDRGRLLVRTSWLRVFHDATLAHRFKPQINALWLANIGLIAFLRYPPRYWPLGIAQVAKRVLYCVGNGRVSGIISGIASIPILAWRWRAARRPVSLEAMRRKRSRAIWEATQF